MEHISYAPTIRGMLKQHNDEMLAFIRSGFRKPRMPLLARLRIAARVLFLGRT